MAPRRLKGKLSRLNARGLNSGASEGGSDALSPSSGGSGDARDARWADLRERMGQLRRGRRTGGGRRPPKNLPGERVEGPEGAVQRVATLFDAGHHHGSAPVWDGLKASGEVVSRLALDDGLRGFVPETALFIDTETTGLAGGAGTLPFVVGLGFYDSGSFQVEQLLLPEPGSEAPVLRRVAERMASASALVSFNGKSYDWPLLRTRFVLNRLPVPQVPPHLDLLHAARRVFKHQLAETRLTSLERDVLGYHRRGDIPGSEIPGRYFEYLRKGDGTLLEDIVVHNRDDIVAMAALLGVLSGLMAGPDPGGDPRVQLALAQLEVRGGEPGRALAYVEGVDTWGAEPGWKLRAFLLGAQVLRRGKEYRLAEDLLLRAVALPDLTDGARGPAHLMLAKLYEHKLGDLEAALAHAERIVGEDGLSKRLTRLRRRLA